MENCANIAAPNAPTVANNVGQCRLKGLIKTSSAKKAVAKKSPLLYSSGIAPAKPLLTAAKVEPGKKRVVKKTNHGDAPF